MAQSTILIADDDADILETLTFRLEQRGFRVIQAHDGGEAIEAFRASGHSADDVRTHDQSENRQGAWHLCSLAAHRQRR